MENISAFKSGAPAQHTYINPESSTSVVKINLAPDISKRISKASKALGIDEKGVVERAVLLFLYNISKQRDLKGELAEWDALSDEALTNFERSL